MARGRSRQEINSFFRDLLRQASGYPVRSVTVNGGKGNLAGLLFFDTCQDERKIKSMLAEIGASPGRTFPPVSLQTEEKLHVLRQESCQVTVEERAQLFGFLAH